MWGAMCVASLCVELGHCVGVIVWEALCVGSLCVGVELALTCEKVLNPSRMGLYPVHLHRLPEGNTHTH